MMTFSEKYRPKKISEVFGQDNAMRSILKIISQKNRKPGAVLIYGPIGCGKNSIINAISNEFNFETVELNASNLRGREKIKKTVRNAVFQRSLFNKRKIIVLDEIDSISRREKSGLIELTYIINRSPYPIFLIANDPYSRNISLLRKKYPLIELKKLESEDILRVLKRICINEQISFDENSLKQISLLSGGDARAAINDLQASGREIKKISISKRDQEIGIFNALRTIFRSNSFSVIDALHNLNIPHYESLMWIDENIPSEFDVVEMKNGYYSLSKADIFHNRTMKHNYWRFEVYSQAFLTAGVCFSKRKVHNKFVNYKRLTRLLKQWQSNKGVKKDTAEKFKEKMHCSKKKVFGEMPYLKLIYQNMENYSKEKLSEELNLNSDEENFLLETR